MITGVELRNIAEQAYNDGVGGYDPWYDTIAAVVRALEPTIANTIKSVLQFDQITSGEHLKGAAWAIKAILGGDQDDPAASPPNFHSADPPKWAMDPFNDNSTSKCGSCGAWMTVVRPGKVQCDNPLCIDAFETARVEMTGVTDMHRGDTSTASFCEWALQKKLKRLPYAYIFKKDCDGLRSTVFAKKKICHHCGKPIKFMAEETVMTAVGEGLPPSSELSPAASFCEWFDGHCDDWEHDHGVSSKAFFGNKSPTHCHHCKKPIKFMADSRYQESFGVINRSERLMADAATIDEDTLIEFVRDWNYSGYHYDLNFARKLKQELLDAGYKVLPREPIKFMADASSRKNEGEGVAKASSSPSAPSAATIDDVLREWRAGFCEWEYQRADVNFLTYETGCLSTIRVSMAVLRDVRNCICCKLVYFKTADEP